jgi:hypothetical protein
MFKWNIFVTGQKHLKICLSPCEKPAKVEVVLLSSKQYVMEYAICSFVCQLFASRRHGHPTKWTRRWIKSYDKCSTNPIFYGVLDEKRNVWLIQEGRLVGNPLLDAASSLLTYKYTSLKYSFVVNVHAFFYLTSLVCICRCPQKCFERLSEDVTREVFCKFHYLTLKKCAQCNLQAFVHVKPTQRKLFKSGDDIHNRGVTSQNIRNGICNSVG